MPFFVPMIAFSDCSGKLRIVKGCALANLQEFSQLITLIGDEFLNGGLPFPALYASSNWFRQLIDRALLLSGIAPEWLSLPMLEPFFYQVSEEDCTPGHLVTLSFPEPKKKSGEPTTLEEFCRSLLVGLVSAGLAYDFSSAQIVAQQLTATEVSDLLDERSRQLDPEGWQKRKDQEFADELAADPMALLNFGGMLGNLPLQAPKP